MAAQIPTLPMVVQKPIMGVEVAQLAIPVVVIMKSRVIAPKTSYLKRKAVVT